MAININSIKNVLDEQEEKKRAAAQPSSSSSKSNSSGKNQKQGGSTAANRLHSDVNLTYSVKKQPTRNASTVRSSSDRLASLDVPRTRLQIAALQQQRDREKTALENWKSRGRNVDAIDSSADLSSRRGSQVRKNRKEDLLEESIWRLDSRISQLQRDIYESSVYQEDFDQYSSAGAQVKTPSLLTANLQREAYLSGRRPKDAALGNEVTFAENNFDKKLSEELFSLNLAGDKSYQYLTDNERQVYNYVLAKEGPQAAGNYLDMLQEELNQRRGTNTGKQVRSIENSFLRTAATGGYAAKSGLENFNSGVKQYFSEDGKPLPTSSVLYASEYIRDDLGPVGGFFYDTTQTLANMAPAVALGGVTAPAIGSGILGVSAGGNAYNQALKEGYSPAEAKRYAALIGASEGAMQYVLGGATKLGGTATQNIVQKTIRNIDSSFLRAAADLGVKMTGEGTEEYLQSILEPAYRNLAFDENNEIRLVSRDAAYSFLLGAITAGLLEGGSVINNEISANRLGAAVKRSGHTEELLANAQSQNAQSESFRLSSQIQSGELHDNDSNIGKVLLAYAQEGGSLEFMKQEAPLENRRAAEEDVVDQLTERLRVTAPQEMATLGDGHKLDVARENQTRGRREASVLGENGSRAFAKAYDLDAANRIQPEDAVQGFAQIYNAALQGKSLDGITSGKAALLPDYMRVAAAGAGKQDAIRASQAKYFGKDAGLIRDETYKKAKLTRKTARILDAVGKAAGIQVRFAEQVAEGRANAQYDLDTGVLTIALDASDPVRVAFTHEMIHRIRQVSPESYNALAKFVRDRMGHSDMALLENQYQTIYDNSDTGYLTEEIVADAFGYLTGEERVLEEFVKANRSAAQRILDAILDFIDAVKQVLRGRNGVQLSPEQKEAFASLQKDMEAMAKTLTAALNQTAETVQNNEKLQQTSKKNTAQQGGGVRYSINRDFQTNVLEWYQEGQPKGEHFVLGSTGPVLQGLGAIESDIYMNGDKISAILREHPEMSIREVQLIPEILEDPTLILKSKGVGKTGNNSRMVLYGSIKAQNGQPMLAVLDLRPRERGFLLNDMQKVNSAYTKNKPVSFVINSDVLYADKKRTVPLLRQFGLTITSRQLLRNGSMGSITYDGDRVKMSGVPFSSAVDLNGAFISRERGTGIQEKTGHSKVNTVNSQGGTGSQAVSSNFSIPETGGDANGRYSLKSTDSRGRKLTAEQQEYFRDSKVVDSQGRLKIMYRGGNDDLTVFDRKKSNYSNMYGRGFYFTDSEAHAKHYGDAKAFYLNITTPVSMTETTISRTQMRKFLKAVAANEDDYSFENYGYDATVDSVLKSVYGKSDFAMLYDVSLSAIGDMVEAVELFNEVNGTAYDGLIMDIETVAFRSNQIKSITNKTPTDDPDIRYSLRKQGNDQERRSLKETSSLLRDVVVLNRQKALLEERLAYWKGQTKRTEKISTNPKEVRKAARRLIAAYQADLDLNEFTANLQAFYDFIANNGSGKENLTGEDVWQRAKELASNLVENSVVRDSEIVSEYQDLLNYLKTTKIQLSPEDIKQIPDYKKLRKQALKGLRLSQASYSNVDEVFQELSFLWPEFFDSEKIQGVENQLKRLSEVLEGVSGTIERNPFSGYMEEAVTGTANEIIELFFDLPQTRPTFADRQAQKLAAAKAEGRNKVQEVRQQNQEQFQKLREQNRQQVQRAIEKERAKREKQLEALKNKYAERTSAGRERQNARLLRARIMRHTKALSQKLLRPTDRQHVPEELRQAVAAVLDAINLESLYTKDPETGRRHKNSDGLPVTRTEAFRQLREQYLKIAGNENAQMVVDPSLLGNAAEGAQGNFDKILAMRDKPIMAMTSAELQTIWDVIKAVEKSISTAGKTLAQTKYATTMAWAKALEEDTASRRTRKTLTAKGISLDLENSITFFSRFGKAGEAVYQMLRDAEDQQVIMLNEIALAVQKVVKNVNLSSLEKQNKTFQVEGGKLTLSLTQIMDLYELSKREQAQQHLYTGGLVQPAVPGTKVRAGTDAIKVTPEDVAKIVSTLTEEQKQIADGLQDIMRGLLADYGNEASMAVYGYKKFTEKDYWPLRTSVAERWTEPEQSNANFRSIKNIGLAKSTNPSANNALTLDSIINVFTKHAADMTDYAAWLAPMEDASRLFNFRYRDEDGIHTGKTVKGILDRVGGPGAQNYWFNLMKDIQNGIAGESDSEIAKIVNRAIGNVKGAAVGGNLRVVIQQPTAFFRAAILLDPTDMARGVARGVTHGSGWQKALKYAPIAQKKLWGGFEISNQSQAGDILFNNKDRLTRFNEALTTPAAKADAFTWGKLWNACEWAIQREQKELTPGTEAFYQAVAKKFSRVINETQVVDGVLQRSQIMRSSSSLNRQMTSFMGEPTMALNMFIRAWDKVRYEQNPQKRGQVIKQLGRAATALVFTNTINAVAQSLIDGLRDDDKEKKYWARFFTALTGLEKGEEEEEKTVWDKISGVYLDGNLAANMDPLRQLPYLKDILSLMQGYSVERMDISAIGDFLQAAELFISDKRTKPYAVKQLATTAAKLFGVSAGNVLRDVWAIARSYAISTDNIMLQYEMEKAIYSLTSQSNKGRYIDLLFLAKEKDPEAYEIIYDQLLQNGYDEKQIRSGMETRMKKAQGVEKTEDLKERYLNPDEEKDYKKVESQLISSPLWKKASAKQKKEVETSLYNLVVETESGLKLQEKVNKVAQHGISTAEYILYQLAKDIADTDKNGSTKQEEATKAVEMLTGLSDAERAYLWQSTNERWKTDNNPWREYLR